MTSQDRRYFQLVLLWPRDRALFARYLERLRAVIEPYGAGLDRQLRPHTVYGQGVQLPETVNLVFYRDREAFTAFAHDPRFAEILPLRTESTAMASVEGRSGRGAAEVGDASKRLYLVELAKLGAGGPAAYRAYEAEAEPVMARYGYRVDRVLEPETASGFPFRPDVVKVASFDSPDGMERLHRDPAHQRLERELYPAAVADSLWLLGASSGP
jgi:uncharacterized protein (DUF1330 family)